jgi:hypothetical protein
MKPNTCLVVFAIVVGSLCLNQVCLGGTYSGGAGTQEDPYQISSVGDWQELIGASGDWDKCFVLMNDIDFGGINLTPVGNGAPLFNGVLDGNGHILRNAVIHLPDTDWVGLFGFVNSGGQIRKLGLENISVEGYNCVGGLCGFNEGTISDCYATGAVTGGYAVGGLCGINQNGTISNCYATGVVTCYNAPVGGLCGKMYAGMISDCYATGTVSGASWRGGLCGENDQYGYGIITACFWDIETSRLTSSAGGTGKTTAEMWSFSTFESAGWNFVNTWYMPSTYYPRLAWQPPLGYGSLRVTILPAEAVAEGAQWRRIGSDAPGVWMDSGQMETEIRAVPWDLEFKPLANWIGPQTVQVCISPTELTQITVTYIPPGSLQVTILPDEAIEEGAQWRRVGTNDWMDSGQIESVLAVPWNVEFKPTTHWRHTNQIQVSISPNDLTTVDATYTIAYSGGSGTPEDPYRISTVADWQELIAASGDWDKHFIMVNDIDFGGIDLGSVGDFTGVFDGNSHVLRNVNVLLLDEFYLIAIGLFKNIGNAGEIRNLGLENVHVGRESSGRYVGGLCGQNNGSITTCYLTGFVEGYGGFRGEWSYSPGGVGGLCGVNQGIIEDCYTSTTIYGWGYENGGLCGSNHGTISGCYTAGVVWGGYSDIGGLCGSSYGTISDCYTSCTVIGELEPIGGLCGSSRSYGTINNSYSTGTVTAIHGRWPGGLCGFNNWGSTIRGCFWDMETSGCSWSDGGDGKTTAEMKTLTTFTAAGWDFTDIWWMASGDYPRLVWARFGSLQVTILPSEAIAEGAQWRRIGASDWLNSGEIEMFVPAGIPYDLEFKPTSNWLGCPTIRIMVSPDELRTVQVLYAEWYSGGSGTQEAPYQISTASQWCMLTMDPINWDKHFVLMNNLDFGGSNLAPVAPDMNQTDWEEEFQGIPFTGVVDGKGHIFRNAVIGYPSECRVGLFGFLANPGQIRNLGVENVTVSGFNRVGGLCGANGQGPYATPPLDGGIVSNCYTTGSVTGDLYYVGGICGENHGTISGCYATGPVTGQDYVGGLCGTNQGTISDCYATGAVSGENYVGGLCGWNWGGAISNSFATGTINGNNWSVGGLCGENSGTIRDCYAKGPVTGRRGVGGLVGNNSGTITACFWDVETSGQTTSSGGTGKITVEMKTLSTFTDAGWDFVGESTNGTIDTWRMCANGVDYPRLSWEFSHGGDFDCPDGIALDDLLYLASRWLATTPETIGSADPTSDGKVDLSDLAILSEHWLQ